MEKIPGIASRAELRRLNLTELDVEQAQWHIRANSKLYQKWFAQHAATLTSPDQIAIRFAMWLVQRRRILTLSERRGSESQHDCACEIPKL